MYCYYIYVGLKDKDNYKNNIDYNDIKSKIIEYFSKTKISFSINKTYGGYNHYNGNYIVENSLQITLIGNILNDNLINLINYLKNKYNQESILVINKKIKVDYIREGDNNEL